MTRAENKIGTNTAATRDSRVCCNHEHEEWVSDKGVTVNNLEGFWRQLKRGINGTDIHGSAKHLPKYLGEFEFRRSMRAVPHLMFGRALHSFAYC